MASKLVALGLLALVVMVQAAPVPEDLPNIEEDALRPKREGPPVRLAEARDDSYGQPAYAPAPSYHKGGPVYVKSFVKTDYAGNFKWGVKHNIDH